MEKIHCPALFWITFPLRKKRWRFRKGFYALTISLSIKDRRLRAILRWKQIYGCKRNILKTVSVSAHITGWMWQELP